MPGGIVGEAQVLAVFRLQEDMIIDPFRREEGRCEVVVTADDPNLHERVAGDIVADNRLLLQVAVLVFFVMPRMIAPEVCGEFVAAVGLEAELAVQVVVDDAAEGS